MVHLRIRELWALERLRFGELIDMLHFTDSSYRCVYNYATWQNKYGVTRKIHAVYIQ